MLAFLIIHQLLFPQGVCVITITAQELYTARNTEIRRNQEKNC